MTKKSNLFEALASYDYEAMINLYASNGIDGLESISNLTSVHYAMPGMPFSLSSGALRIVRLNRVSTKNLFSVVCQKVFSF